MENKKERVLFIVESPNKVASLKSFLPKNYVVMASVGHISGIKDGSGYHNTGIDVDDGFKPDFEVSKDKKEVVSKLKEQVKLADRVCLATDPDREGEAIAWSLRKFLKIPESKYQRITYHEITKNAVLKALDNPRKIDEDLVSASHARQEWDKMLGYRMSTIGRNNVGAKSVGRCQSAGLLLITNKEDSIRNFIPDKYGELVAYLSKNGQEFKAKYLGTDNKKPSYEECLRVSEEIDASLKEGNMFEVSNVERKQSKSSPKPPFITSTFQQEVSSKLGIGVEQAMNCAQKLFEGINIGGEHLALITYIRTDDATLSPEFEATLEAFVKDAYGDKYCSKVKKAKNAENAQAGHEAIRPTDLAMTPTKLKQYITDERLVKVYEIVYRRTIACAMPQSVTSETVYTLKQSNHEFSMTSKELLFDGYQRVYSYKDKEDEETIKETFEAGERVKCIGLEAEQKQTNPPARYREATFIKELEKTGIGRPSTYATILKTLLKEDRGYCTIQDKCLVPTEKGMALANFLKDKFPDIINIEYTSDMEKDLDKIANGKLGRLDFLKASLDAMEKSIKKANIQDSGYSTNEVCPQCGAPMRVRKGPYGLFLGCSKYPECKGIRYINKNNKRNDK